MYKPEPYFEGDIETTVTEYQILSPIKLTIKRKDGLEILTGFGIGDKIEVIEPSMQSLACKWEPWKEIPLKDGSILLDPLNKLTQVIRIG